MSLLPRFARVPLDLAAGMGLTSGPADCFQFTRAAPQLFSAFPCRRVWFGNQASGRSLTVSSCDSSDQSGDTHVSIRSTSNQSNPLAGPWICVR